jgi:CubicO group peptidase (beta-lactamase class C family)
MKQTHKSYSSLIILVLTLLSASGFHCATKSSTGGITQEGTDSIVKPVMEQYNIAGMAIGITVNGKRSFFNYGVASKSSGQAVTNETLFEIGSLSKTFTATLAAYGQVKGNLSLSDSVSKYLPVLKGSSFDHIQLIHLATHTAGGLPLQLPDSIKDTLQLISYYRQWRPLYAPGAYRVYSNPGIGLLGIVTAKSMGQPFTSLIESKLFRELGLTNSYIDVPADKMKNYAQGYNKKDSAVRLNPAVLALEAYAVKSCTRDLLRFLEVNMQVAKVDKQLEQAIALTHEGYVSSGALVQDMIWEEYDYPASLGTLLDGNSEKMIFDAVPASKINLAAPSRHERLLDKTGSTNGFSAYTLFIPSKKTGIVILANKSYPLSDRVTLAYQLLTRL